MFLLQRWEPIVSDSFPATIPFWITIHGIPLHYWSDDSLRAIGKALGPVETTDEVKGRVRVVINGLKPLEKFLEISLKSGETKTVELEYEKLEKHCFSCRSLSHEAGNFPSTSTSIDSSPQLGIMQLRTLDRIAESRKRADNRKLSRFSPYDRRSGEPHINRRIEQHPRDNPQHRTGYHNRYDDRRDHRRVEHHDRYNSYSEDRDREGSRPPPTDFLPPVRESSSISLRSNGVRSAHPTAKTFWRPVSEEGSGRQAPSGRQTHSVQSQVSHTPSPRTQREPMTAARGALINSPHTPKETSVPSGERRSALERISGTSNRTPLPLGETSTPAGERRSALERISGEPDRVPLLRNGVANSDSGRLQEVNIQYLEDALPYKTPPGSMVPSTSKAAVAGSSNSQAARGESPIRTLSEDRAHVSLRLGALPPLPIHNSPPPSFSKAAGKQKAPRAPPRKRVQSSPVQGVSLTPRRRVTKAKGSPKRKIPATTKAKGKAPAKGDRPATTLIPAITKKRADFRTAAPSLP